MNIQMQIEFDRRREAVLKLLQDYPKGLKAKTIYDNLGHLFDNIRQVTAFMRQLVDRDRSLEVSKLPNGINIIKKKASLYDELNKLWRKPLNKPC